MAFSSTTPSTSSGTVASSRVVFLRSNKNDDFHHLYSHDDHQAEGARAGRGDGRRSYQAPSPYFEERGLGDHHGEEHPNATRGAAEDQLIGSKFVHPRRGTSSVGLKTLFIFDSLWFYRRIVTSQPPHATPHTATRISRCVKTPLEKGFLFDLKKADLHTCAPQSQVDKFLKAEAGNNGEFPTPPTPKFPGVYWCSDQGWIKYPPARSQHILEAHEGLVNIGPAISIGAKGSSDLIWEGDYKVNLIENMQVSPTGIRRRVVIVPSTPDRVLLALMDRIKDLYYLQVKHFLEEGNTHHSREGKKPPTLAVRDKMWDLQCALMRQFLELAMTHGASESDPSFLFGYHGTSAENSEKIFNEGFSPECRYCGNGAGAYFSGKLEHSAMFAKDHHETDMPHSARPTSDPEGPGDILLVVLLVDGNKSGQDIRAVSDEKPVLNVERCIFDEKYALPLARLRGF